MVQKSRERGRVSLFDCLAVYSTPRESHLLGISIWECISHRESLTKVEEKKI